MIDTIYIAVDEGFVMLWLDTIYSSSPILSRAYTAQKQMVVTFAHTNVDAVRKFERSIKGEMLIVSCCTKVCVQACHVNLCFVILTDSID